MRLFFKRCVYGIFVVNLLTGCSLAEDGKTGFFQGIEALGGWGQANLKTKQDYHFIPLVIDFDFNLKELSHGLKNYPGLLQFQIEPGFSYVTQPNKNIEASAAFAFKAGLFPETWRFQPYLKAGAGGIYTTQHIPEQSTQLNFCEHVGLGAHYFVDSFNALSFEIRYRHISNADIKKPNKGISGYITLVGLAHKF
jgi:hypothetical protein